MSADGEFIRCVDQLAEKLAHSIYDFEATDDREGFDAFEDEVVCITGLLVELIKTRGYSV